MTGIGIILSLILSSATIALAQDVVPPSLTNTKPAYTAEATKNLAEALRENYSLQELEHLLATGANPNGFEHGNGSSMLTLTAKKAGTDMHKRMALLLAYGANPNLADGYKSLPACAIVEGFQSSPMNSPELEKSAAAALFVLAAKQGDVGWFCDNINNNALHIAARKGAVVLVKQLLELNVDPTQKNSSGYTPLMEAANATTLHSEAEIVAQLLRSDGMETVDWANAYGETALYIAVNKETPEIAVVTALLKASNLNAKGKRAPLIAAAARENVEVVKLLLDKKADPNILADNTTPLLEAVYAKQDSRALAVTKMLLAAGAQVNLANSNGVTPLMAAVSGRHPQMEVVRELLSAKADKARRDSFGETAADKARFYGHLELAELLQ